MNRLIDFIVVNDFLKMQCCVETFFKKLIVVELFIQFFSYIVIQSISRTILKYLTKIHIIFVKIAIFC